jgi:hypothetical protein
MTIQAAVEALVFSVSAQVSQRHKVKRVGGGRRLGQVCLRPISLWLRILITLPASLLGHGPLHVGLFIGCQILAGLRPLIELASLLKINRFLFWISAPREERPNQDERDQ